jgi:putative endonuclease
LVEDNKLQSQEHELAPHLSALSRRKATGRAGEEAAAAHLEQLGYRLVIRNWRCPAGEIDLIAEDGSTLVFIEVRSRTNPTRYGSAVEAITPRKCRQVRELAAFYLKQRNSPSISLRFDVVAVTFLRDGAVAEIKHLQGAF